MRQARQAVAGLQLPRVIGNAHRAPWRGYRHPAAARVPGEKSVASPTSSRRLAPGRELAFAVTRDRLRDSLHACIGRLRADTSHTATGCER